MKELVALLVPLGVCVVLPVLIVWLVTRSRINAQNRHTEVMIEALKSNSLEAAEAISAMLKKTEKTPLERLMVKFGWGSVLTLIGIGLIVICCIMSSDPNFADEVNEMLIVTICLLGVGIGMLITFFVQKKMMNSTSD